MADSALIEKFVAKGLIGNSTFMAQFIDDANMDAYIPNVAAVASPSYGIAETLGWLLSRSDYPEKMVTNPWFEQMMQEAMFRDQLQATTQYWTYINDLDTTTFGYYPDGVAEGLCKIGYYNSTDPSILEPFLRGENFSIDPTQGLDLSGFMFNSSVTRDEDISYVNTLGYTVAVNDSYGIPIYEDRARTYPLFSEIGLPAADIVPKFEIDGAYIGDMSKYIIRMKFIRNPV